MWTLTRALNKLKIDKLKLKKDSENIETNKKKYRVEIKWRATQPLNRLIGALPVNFGPQRRLGRANSSTSFVLFCFFVIFSFHELFEKSDVGEVISGGCRPNSCVTIPCTKWHLDKGDFVQCPVIRGFKLSSVLCVRACAVENGSHI